MGLFNWLKNTANKAQTWFKEKANPFIQDVATGFKQGFNKVVDFGAPILGAIPGVGGAAEKLVRTGQTLANTVADGIASGSNLIAGGDFKGAYNQAKNTLGQSKALGNQILSDGKEVFKKKGANVQR